MTDAARTFVTALEQNADLRYAFLTVISELRTTFVSELVAVSSTWDGICFARGEIATLDKLVVLLEKESRDARSRADYDRRSGVDPASR